MGLFSRKSSKPANLAQTGQKNGQTNGLPKPRKGTSLSSTSAMTAPPKIPAVPLPKAPDPNVDPVAYLRSIYAVRERSQLVLEKAKRNQLKHFVVDMGKFSDTARYVVSIIKVGAPLHFQTLSP
jgi:hypothetical protein